jgi:hypothetical protein
MLMVSRRHFRYYLYFYKFYTQFKRDKPFKNRKKKIEIIMLFGVRCVLFYIQNQNHLQIMIFPANLYVIGKSRHFFRLKCLKFLRHSNERFS